MLAITWSRVNITVVRVEHIIGSHAVYSVAIFHILNPGTVLGGKESGTLLALLRAFELA